MARDLPKGPANRVLALVSDATAGEWISLTFFHNNNLSGNVRTGLNIFRR
jgi:hypothetical protein